MKKLFTCFYGSRLYGTQTPTSDIDIKHIVLPDLNDLLLGKKLANKVKKTNNEKNTRNTVDDVDEEFIPIQVFAQDFYAGQTYALELAFAVDGSHAGQVFPLDSTREQFEEILEFDDLYPFYPFVRELRSKFLTSNIKAMMGYVVNQTNIYSFKGERLNVVRKVKEYLSDIIDSYGDCTIAQFYSADYSDRTFLVDQIASVAREFPKYFKVTEYDIGDGRMMPCYTLLEKTLPFSSTLKHTYGVVKTLEAKYGSRSNTASESNVDWKAMMHALRIVDEGICLLKTGKIELPLKPDYVKFLLEIKRGEHQLSMVKAELDAKLTSLKELEQTTFLPAASHQLQNELDSWLAGQLRKFYQLI